MNSLAEARSVAFNIVDFGSQAIGHDVERRKRKSKWAQLYAPDRKPLKAAKNWVMENSTALKNLAEYMTPGEISSADELKPGQGAILRKGLKKIAAYRDDNGVVHQHSAACTHLGCHLHWNSFEHCWDCPCHGSIFGPDGNVLNAPAISGMDPVL